MTWSSSNITAATGPIAFPAFAVELDLPSGAVRLLDGAGSLTIGGNTFSGQDANFGMWISCDTFEDGIALQSSKVQLSLALLNSTAVVNVGAVAAQGSAVTFSLGFVNQASGALVAAPITLRTGFLDYAKITLGENQKTVDCDIVSAFEYLAIPNDGATLTSGYHNLFFPGETAFDFVSNVTNQIPWGQSGPRPDQVTQVRNYNTGGSQPGKTTLNYGGVSI